VSARQLAWLAAAMGLALAPLAAAQPAPTAVPKTAPEAAPKAAPKASAPAAPSAAPSAPAAPAASATPEDAPLPPGHPPMDGAPGDLPPRHPPMGGSDQSGFFRPPPDQVAPDEQLPAGTLEITIADADSKPIPNAPIRLVVLESTVTRGEKEHRIDRRADAEGRFRFDDLQFGSGVQYTLLTTRGEAEFTTHPFQLRDTSGMRALLHSYEPVTDLRQTTLVMEAVVMVEVKEDSFAISHRLRTLNLGRTAFVASDVSIELPGDFHAFNNQDAEGPMKMVERDGRAVLVGTFPPGQGEIFFRYQVPLTGDSTQSFRLPLPPRVVHTTVLVSAGPAMGLEVAGFPKAAPERWHNGQRVLKTLREPDVRFGMEALLVNVQPTSLDITVSGIPTPGFARWLAVLVACAALLGGAFYLYGRRSGRIAVSEEEREDLREARDALLEELATLEMGRASGDVGPRSYERIRASLLDALARIVTELEAHGERSGYRGKAPKPKSAADEPERVERDGKRDGATRGETRSVDAGKRTAKRKRKKKRRLKPATTA
jgi:hypothetical protein